MAAFKVGPDFIDPGHHTRITGRASRNLDGWMLTRAYNRQCFSRHSAGADVVVVEGVMGLFDGYDGKSDAGSTAQMAKWLGLPVILAVDAKSMARSTAALVQGFERFDPELTFAGVIFNNVAGDRHLAYLKDALENHVRMPFLGAIRRRPDITIPERHLGLVTAADHPLTSGTAESLAGLIEDGLDLDDLLDRLPTTRLPASEDEPAAHQSGNERPVRIGVAMDNAFCFYYADNLDLLADRGAEIVPFSPLSDAWLPADLDGLYFGGGYPELYAENLSENSGMRRDIHRAVRHGMPVYGECGGFMYLGRTLHDPDGRCHAMAGCFPLDFKMHPKLRSMGYREITLTADTLLGTAGQRFRGHEFHYSEMSGDPGVPMKDVYRVTTRAGLEKPVPGFRTANCLGSYVHLHFGSNPQAARTWVSACRKFRSKRINIR